MIRPAPSSPEASDYQHVTNIVIDTIPDSLISDPRQENPDLPLDRETLLADFFRDKAEFILLSYLLEVRLAIHLPQSTEQRLKFLLGENREIDTLMSERKVSDIVDRLHDAMTNCMIAQ